MSSTSGKTGHLTIRLVHSTAYVNGDAFGLQWGGFGALPPSYAGKWLSIPHNSSIYPLVARNVTIGSLARGCVPGGQLSLVGGGGTARGLRGTAPEGGVLTTYVKKSGTPLPVEGIEVERGARVGLGHVTLSDWNEPVHVEAPAHSVRVG